MNKTLLACSAVLLAFQLQAQTKYVRYPHNLDIAAGGGLHSVQFTPKQHGDQDPLFGGTINLHYRYAPNERWSFGTGIDFTSYRAESEYDYLDRTMSRVDPENGYTYTYHVNFNNWREVQNSINLEIPLGAYYRLPLNDVWGLVAGGGVKLELPISKRYKTRNDKSDGYLDRAGYFEETNVDYSDMPQHDFFKSNDYQGNAKMKGAGLGLFIDLVATRPLKDNKSIYFGGYYSHSVLNNNGANNNLYDASTNKYSGVVSSDLASRNQFMAVGLKVGLSLGFPKIDSTEIKKAMREEEEARLAREQAIADSIAAAEAEMARIAAEKAEQERLAAEKAEAERKAAELEKAQEVVAWLNKNIRVNFALGKADVVSTPEVEENIDFIIKFLRNNPDRILVVVGHTCDLGKPEKNVDLSKRRAEAMKAVLVERGCNPSNIETIGKGPYEPLVPNTSEANRKKNRRIEIQIGKYQEKDIQ